MTRDEINNLLQSLQAEEAKMNRTKGEGYANNDDALANFKRAAQNLDLSPLQICAVYMGKHFDAIMSYAKHGEDITGEGLFGRVVDLRLYAALFLALAREIVVGEGGPRLVPAEPPSGPYYQGAAEDIVF